MNIQELFKKHKLFSCEFCGEILDKKELVIKKQDYKTYFLCSDCDEEFDFYALSPPTN